MTTQKRSLGNSLERTLVERAQRAGVPAKRQPRSGELAEFPADAVVANLLVEAKVRSARLDAKGSKILSLDMTWLDKVEKLAAKSGQRGLVVARMKGSPKLLAVLDFELFLSFLRGLDGESENSVQ